MPALNYKRVIAMYNFIPEMPLSEVNRISTLGLAHVGDGVYELLVRSLLCRRGHSTVAQLHKLTVAQVKAPAQAAAVHKLLPELSEEELAVYRRGRNTRVNSVPHNAGISQYHAATGLEALFGWLYLQGKTERISHLFALIAEDIDDAT